MTRIAVIGGGISGLAAAHRLVELNTGRFKTREGDAPAEPPQRETSGLSGSAGASPSQLHGVETTSTDAGGRGKAERAPEGRSVQVTLFESRARLGGVIGTERIGDYLVERGADSFITVKPWALNLCRRLGLEQRLISTEPASRRSLVLCKGKPVEVPDGFLLMAPAKIWPVLSSPLLSPFGKLRMGLEYFIPRRKAGASDETLASFVRRRFGREVFDRIVQPLVGGIYTADPEKLSLRATLPRFLDWERDFGSLIRAARREQGQRTAPKGESGARYGMFATLVGGMAELFDALIARISTSAEIRMKTRVVAIKPSPAGTGYELSFDSGASETFDAVVLAIPAYRVAALVEPFDQSLAAMLNSIEYASSAIVVTGHKLADIRHPLDAAGLVIPAVEKRQILSVSFSSRKFAGRAPEGRVILRTFVGGALQPELFEKSDEELIALVRRELSELLGVGGEAEFAIVARYERAMPQYHVGHLDRLAQINDRLSRHPRLALAGNAFEGVGVPDCIHSGEQGAERALAVIQAR